MDCGGHFPGWIFIAGSVFQKCHLEKIQFLPCFLPKQLSTPPGKNSFSSVRASPRYRKRQVKRGKGHKIFTWIYCPEDGMGIAAFILQEQPGKNCSLPNVIICRSRKQVS